MFRSPKVAVLTLGLILVAGCGRPPQDPQVKASPLIHDSFVAVPLTMTATTATSAITGAVNNSDLSSKNGPQLKTPFLNNADETSTNVTTPDAHTALTSIGEAPPPLLTEDNYLVGIKKSALEKEFLLHASLIPQEGAATSTGLKSRVVAFRQRGQSVFMLEATQGHVVTTDLPATLILAEIPVIKDTGDVLILDFNKGMGQIFVTQELHASDQEGKSYSTSTEAATVTHSFIQDMKLDDSLMEIDQIAQVQATKEDRQGLPTYEVKYYISPYVPSTTYQPRETSDFTQVGFMEVAPTIETGAGTGRATTYIARWDISKPITYYVSANTPQEYIEAVKEGVLYWNAAFGREIIKVEMAPQGVTAPDPRYNIIQWVPDDSAGYAYADNLSDPRTGEILHSQVYLTSSFALIARARMPAVVRRLKADAAAATARKTAMTVGIKFLGSSRICDMDPDPTLPAALEDAAAQVTGGKNGDAAFLRIAQDYIRATVAHEVGHTLGLRHNFAGSLATQMNAKDRDEAFSAYLQNGTAAPDVALTSSYMDYLVIQDDLLTSRRMQDTHGILEYDKNAIQWAYMGQALPANTPLFCSEGQVGKFDDCLPFDTGAEALVADYQAFLAGVRNIATGFAETYISARAPLDQRDHLPVEKVAINSGDALKTTLAAYKQMVHWFQQGSRSLVVERQFPVVDSVNQAQVDAAKYAWVKKQVDELGGVDKTLFSLLPAIDRPAEDFQKEGMDKLAAYLARDDVRSGTAPDGSSYSLTDAEVAYIKTQGVAFFAQVDDTLDGDILDLLTSAPLAQTKTDFDNQLETRIGDVSEAIIATPGAPIPGLNLKAGMTMNNFKYALSLREKAAKLVPGGMGQSIDWSQDSREKIFEDLMGIIKNVLGPDPSKVDVSALPRPIRQWLMEQQLFLKVLEQ